MRLVFFGTPAVAVPVLHAVHEAGHTITLVITQPPRRRSRGGATTVSPVHEVATELGLAVRTPTRAGEITDEIAVSGADAGVVAAFGQLLPPPLLAAVPQGLLNLHLSLLPRWRGAAPVERAILAGDDETGVCVMRIDAGLDTGPVYRAASTPIGPDETAGELTARLITLGIPMLLDVLEHLRDLEPHAQVGEPTYAEKLTVDEFHLDPSRPAAELNRLVRAGNPRPGAWLVAGGTRVKVWRAHASSDQARGASAAGEYGVVGPGAELGTRNGVLVLDEVQPEGKRAMRGDAWLDGYRTKQVRLPVA